jgi:hypothetical protein
MPKTLTWHPREVREFLKKGNWDFVILTKS